MGRKVTQPPPLGIKKPSPPPEPPPKRVQRNGELELDKERGVIWFNDENGVCRLRISGLTHNAMKQEFIDINLRKEQYITKDQAQMAICEMAVKQGEEHKVISNCYTLPDIFRAIDNI